LKGLSSRESGKANLTDGKRLAGLERAIELQSKLNEHFENQMKIVQAVLEKTQKMLRLFIVVSFIAIGLALLAIILFILRIYKHG